MSTSDAPAHGPPANRLLAALPAREYARLRPYLSACALEHRAVLYEPGARVSHVYFPCSGVLSMLLGPPDSRGVEVGVVGREGMAGLSVFFGTGMTPARCVVQVPGEALRMRAADFRRHVGRDGALHGLLLRYTHVFLAQVGLALACNSLHALPRRLCRWLLMIHNRAGADEFSLTHEFLAAMLGVRRATVTEAALGLQQKGLVRYGRGRMTILDRRGLESAACRCYGAIQSEMDHLPG
jgi:CRP-like cAMP-binding protein